MKALLNIVFVLSVSAVAHASCPQIAGDWVCEDAHATRFGGFTAVKISQKERDGVTNYALWHGIDVPANGKAFNPCGLGLSEFIFTCKDGGLHYYFAGRNEVGGKDTFVRDMMFIPEGGNVLRAKGHHRTWQAEREFYRVTDIDAICTRR